MSSLRSSPEEIAVLSSEELSLPSSGIPRVDHPSSSSSPVIHPPAKCQLGQGIITDIRNRLPYYWDDWSVGFTDKKVLSTILYIFFTNILPALSFALLLSNRTSGALGVSEVILAMGIGGSLFSFFAGQPLVIVGVTGPVSIFVATLYDVSVRFGIPFFGYLFYTSLWAAIFHILLALNNACRFFPTYVTPFSEDIFGFLICTIYLYEGIRELVGIFATHPYATSEALLSLLFGLGTMYLSLTLAKARSWFLFSKGLRSFIADFGPSFTIIFFTALQFVPIFTSIPLPRLNVPSSFSPSLPKRPWIDTETLSTTPVWAIFSAILPALILTGLLFFDHNISSMLSQRKAYNLRKPPSFDWDFCLLGVSVFLTGLLGLPPNYGLIPQAPLHVRSLAKIREETNGTLKQEIWIKVCENRVSNFGQSMLIFGLLSSPLLYAIGRIPTGVLAGLFLYMGIAGLQGNTLYVRLQYLAMDKVNQRGVHLGWAKMVSGRTLWTFVLLQLLLVAGIFLLTLTEVGIIFPILIVLLIPLRTRILPRFYGSNLHILDPTANDTVIGTEEGSTG